MLTDAPPRKKDRQFFLESDRLRSIDVPAVGRLCRISHAIEFVMKAGSMADVRRHATEFDSKRCSRDDPGPGVGNAQIPPDSSKSRFICAILIALATILQVRVSFSLSRPVPQRSSLLIDGIVDFLYRSYDLFELGCRAENHGNRLCIIGL